MLQPDKRKQLDSNIRKMLENGASPDDVKAYALDFNSKYEKKKSLPSASQNQKSDSEVQNTNGLSATKSYDEQLNILEADVQKPIDSVYEKTENNKKEIERNVNAINELYAFEDANKTELEQAEQRKTFQSDLLKDQPKEIVDAYNAFTQLDELNEDALAEIDQQISEEKKGDFGMLSNAWSATKDFFGYSDDRKVSDRDKLIEKRIEQNRIDFLNELDNPEIRKTVANIRLQERFKADQSLRDNELLIQNKALESNAFIERINRINDNQKQLVKALETEKNPETQKAILEEAKKNEEEFKNYQGEITKIRSEAETLIENLETNKENISTFTDELNLLKRNYQWLENQKETLKLGFADVGNSFNYTFNNIKAGLQGGETIISEADENLDQVLKENQEQAMAFKRFTNSKREMLEPKIEVSDIDSVPKFGQFAIESTIENIPILAQFAAGRAGVGSFFVSQQASEELDIRQGIIDDKKALEQYNLILNNPEKRKNYSTKEISNMERQRANIMGKRKLTELDIATMSSTFAASEVALGYLGKIRLVNKGKRVAQSIGQQELKTVTKQTMLQSFGRQSWDLIKDASGEGFEELGTGTLKNLVEIAYVGDTIDAEGNERTLGDGAVDNFVGGFAVGSNLSGTTKAVGNALGFVANKERRTKVAENTLEAIKLLQQSETPGLTKAAKDVLINKANSLYQDNAQIINATEEQFKNLNPEDKAKIRTINNEIQSLNLSKSKIKDEASAELIESRLEELDNEKKAVLDNETISESKKETTTETEQPTVEETTPKTEVESEEVETNIKTQENAQEEIQTETKNTEEVQIEDTENKETVLDETQAQGDTTVNENVSTRVEPSPNTEQDNKSQPSSNITTSESEIEVKETVKRINPKGVKGEFDVTTDSNGNITKITKTDGTEVKKFVEVNGKPRKNSNYTRIESEALGVKTDSQIRQEEKAELNNALEQFTPTTAYEYALEYLGRGNKLDPTNVKNETGLTDKEVKWATFANNKGKLPSIQKAAEDIVANSEQDLDMQDVVNALIDLVSKNSSVKPLQDSIKQQVSEANETLERQELNAYLSGLSEQEFAMFEANKVEDDYISELSDKEVEEYFEQKVNEYEQAQNTIQSRQDTATRNEKTSKTKKSKSERKAAANAKVDEIVDAINSIDTISVFGKDIKIKIDDVDGINKNGHDFVAIIASIVKQAIAAGIEIDVAIENTIAHFKSKFNVDVNADDVKAKLEPKKKTTTKANPKKPNEREKSVLTKAAKGGVKILNYKKD